MSERLWHEKTEFEGAAKLSDRLLRRSGALKRFPPNMVTAFGGVLVLPMYLAFRADLIVLGAALFTVSMVTDWLDGALARYQQRESELSTFDLKPGRSEWLKLGPTELGKKLDPVVDKLRYFAALFPLGWASLPHWLVWTSLGIAFALTFFREVVRLIWGIKPGANAVGKVKVYVEIGVIAFLVLHALGMPPELSVFLAATGLGLASLVTQGQSIRRQIKDRRP